MAQIKAHEFDRFASSAQFPYALYLVYGPDRGLVSERAGIIARKSGVDLSDAFSVVKLDADEIRREPGRLIDEAGSIGLFGGRRLVWLRDAGNDRGIASAFEQLAADAEKSAGETSVVLIEAGDLKKGSALRKAAEDAKAALAIPCYADERRGIEGLIDEELSKAGAPRLAPDARRRLVQLLGGDRLASRSELQKLALYARGQAVIDDADVLTLVGDASAVSIDDAVDAVLTGDVAGLDRHLAQIVASKTAVFLVLQATLRQFQTLDLMAHDMAAKRMSVADVMASRGRGLHFRRKPLIERALSRWSPQALEAVTDHLQQAILESRRRASLEDDIARHALLAVALRARRVAAPER